MDSNPLLMLLDTNGQQKNGSHSLFWCLMKAMQITTKFWTGELENPEIFNIGGHPIQSNQQN